MSDNPLLVAYEALVKSAVVVSHPNGYPVKRKVPSLLAELEAAIVSSTAAGAGGGSLASERNPLTFPALELIESIGDRLRAWILTINGERPQQRTSLVDLCKRWYVLHLSTSVDDAHLVRVLEGWEDSIRTVLDPPKTIEITRPCPICGKEWIDIGPRGTDGNVHPLDSEIVRVLNASIVDTITGPDYLAVCRACEAVWKGIDAVRYLAVRIDELERHANGSGGAIFVENG